MYTNIACVRVVFLYTQKTGGFSMKSNTGGEN